MLMLNFNDCIPLPDWRRKKIKSISSLKKGPNATSFCSALVEIHLLFINQKKFLWLKMNFVDERIYICFIFKKNS